MAYEKPDTTETRPLISRPSSKLRGVGPIVSCSATYHIFYLTRFCLQLWLIVFALTLALSTIRLWTAPNPSDTDSDSDFAHLSSHCDHIKPIPTKSYIARQDELAQTLHSLGASAYIAEPGANAAFYANLSGSHWHISERPLLLIVTPALESGAVKGNISILTPTFEATRARLLPVPSDEDIGYPEWPEDVDPYEVAVSAIPSLKEGNGIIYVDGSMRQFVVDGLQRAAAGSQVAIAPVEIRRLRERKSEEELAIMKCVNEVRHTVTIFRS